MSDVRRRELLTGLGAAVLAGCASGSERLSSPVCMPAPEQVAGPFVRGAPIERRDIVEDRAGVPLALHLTLLSADRCEPLAGARCSIWHADAMGIYSDAAGQGQGETIDSRGTTFLRGTQTAGRDGVVEFKTIVPGWYPGRVTHVHVRVSAGNSVLTTQLYFPDEVTRRVYQRPPYNQQGWRDTEDETDPVRLDAPSGDELRLSLREDGVGFATAHAIALRRR